MRDRREPALLPFAFLLATGLAGSAFAVPNLSFVRHDYPSSVSEVIGVAAADFNEDGKPDIAVTGFDGRAAVLINSGSGFVSGPPHVLGTFGTPFWIAAADFDGDGHSDAVVAPIFTSELSWLRGNGTGALLDPPTILPVGDSPLHIVAADLDLDGRVDLLVANDSSPFITVLYGGGPRVDLAVPFQSHTTAVADFNEDGRLDIAVSFSSFAEEVGLLLAGGPPRGFLPFQLVGNNFGYHMATGDFDGDGHADLVTAPLGFANVWWLRGHGNATFTATVVDSPGSFQNNVRAGDLNCDGRDDAVVVGPDQAVVLTGDAALGLVHDGTLASGPDSDTAAIADYDGDGVNDIAFPNAVGVGQVAVFSNVTVLLDCPPDQTVDPGPSCLVDLAATSCDHTLVITSQPPLPAPLAPGAHPIVFTATDPDGRSATCSTVVTVVDTTPPVLVGVPADAVAECDAVPPPAMPAATDCDPSTAIAFTETRSDGSCPDAYLLVRTWTATDGSGNSVSASQHVEVRDTVAPVLTGCALVPAAPPAPAPAPRAPRSAGSACSAASSAVVRVECGSAADACDPAPLVVARVVLTRHVVEDGGCVVTSEEVAVDCGELLVLRRLAPPCPARPPRSPLPPVAPGSNGIRVLSGETIRLEVTAADRCGNLAAPCTVEATAPGGPLPCAPSAPRCPVSACGN